MSSFVFLALYLPIVSHCVSITYKHTDIISKSKVQLSPILVSCELNDIVIIAAPLLDTRASYYLHKPNNEVLKLQIPSTHNNSSKKHDVIVKYINKDVKSVHSKDRNIVINNLEMTNEDVVKAAVLEMKENEFMIGPLLEEDHGNWLLNVYFKDLDDQWTELFKVITIEIVERVSLEIVRPELAADTMYISFAWPIKYLTTCELTVPRSTYDRFFDRSKIGIDKCGYVIHNMTKSDEGTWQIIGVGKIVYVGSIQIYFEGDNTAILNYR